MTNASLAGIYSALITPFHADGAINDAMLGPLLNFEIAQGIDGFYVGGSTGEAFLQSVDERCAFLGQVAKANAGRSKLIAHVGAIATADCIKLGQVAKDAGYQAFSAIPPFYFDFSREELLAHYRALVDAVDLPFIVYNFAGRSGRLTADDILELLDHPRIVGVKHTSQDLFQLERFKRAKPDAIIYNGFDEVCLAGLSMGADGAIGTTFNFMGGLFVALRAAHARSDHARAQQLQVRANRIIDVLIEVGVFPGTKGILKLLGFDCGACRAPFKSLTAEDWKKLEGCVELLASITD
ncbi:N-acetylneuraminate lyase [Devosia sp. YIM 151766]|uniref:N-acetylneuraminate lyase n=1 Tax=Devosia sp. YIM 151766 TaxID=3017325 RepID=UPI00255C5AE4|nr:N-acetylneuraminate lyase [Devosia sp. YIM 151766]WIY53899.1 N-acetylneuraminate lyase [Devosia sp. YIM 151766]